MKLFNFEEEQSIIPDVIKSSVNYIVKMHDVLKSGENVIPDLNIIAIKLAYKTHINEEAFNYELHRDVFDVHFIYSGNECVSVISDAECKLTKTYNEELDVAIYESNEFRAIKLNQFNIAVFDPGELHSTGFRYDSDDVVKYVIKIPRSKISFL